MRVGGVAGRRLDGPPRAQASLGVIMVAPIAPPAVVRPISLVAIPQQSGFRTLRPRHGKMGKQSLFLRKLSCVRQE